DLARHVETALDLDEVWSYINPQMLFGKHLGFKGRFSDAVEAGDEKALELLAIVDKVKDELRADDGMHARAVWQFFEVEPDGNNLHLFGADDRSAPIASFTFPRQRKDDGLALPDLALPPERDGEGRVVKRDHIAMFVTTAGDGIRARAEKAKDAGEYVRSYAMQALALESAEAAAELIHARIRELWGFPDDPNARRKDLFQAHYRGKRYSFGYPACPELADQATLFRLLQPEEIGVELTEGFMMDPEASVSALVFHHPDAIYFAAGESAIESPSGAAPA
ncbi:MAG: vitamin B12 dependent-methionine synthase activation domain-containing protein, partial [Candidatus Eisenbacteria bacterium]